MATLGKVLKLFRITEERNTKSIAKEMGLSSAYISEVEHGNKIPSITMLKKFSKCYGIPYSDFFRIEEISTKNEFSSTETFLEVALTWFKYHDPEYLIGKTFESPSKI